MIVNKQRIIQFTLLEEGGYQDSTADPGNFLNGVLIGTNYGISAPTLAEWRKATVTADDMRQLAEAEASAIYDAMYWQPINGDSLGSGVDLMVFDFGVNAGPQLAVEMMQGLLHVEADGLVGPITVMAVGSMGRGRLVGALASAQGMWYSDLGRWSDTFGLGYLGRLGRRLALAAALAGGA